MTSETAQLLAFAEMKAEKLRAASDALDALTTDPVDDDERERMVVLCRSRLLASFMSASDAIEARMTEIRERAGLQQGARDLPMEGAK